MLPSKRVPLLFAVTGICLLPMAGCAPTNQYAPPPPPKVTVARPLVQTVNDYLEESGSTEAVELVQVRARVRGFIEKINFEPGEEVRGETGFYDEELASIVEPAAAGRSAAEGGAAPTPSPAADAPATPKKADVLFVIEKQLYQAEVAQQQAALNIATSEFNDADVQYRRAIPLAEKGVITQEELGIRKAAMEVAKAKIESAQAMLNEAKINLAYCDVVSPIDGRVGKPLVKLGNLVDGGEATHLVTVIRYDPIYVNFSISETKWQEIVDKMTKDGGEIPRDEYKEIEMTAARQIDGDEYPFQGHLNYYNLDVEESTGTVPIRGIFENPDKRLYPGMFVKVRVKPREPLTDAILVPEASIGTDQTGRYVLIVNDQDIVKRRYVQVGPRVKHMRVLREGVQPNDRVIIDGAQRARVDGKVEPKVVPLKPLESDGSQLLTDDDGEKPPPPKAEELDDSAAAIFED